MSERSWRILGWVLLVGGCAHPPKHYAQGRGERLAAYPDAELSVPTAQGACEVRWSRGYTGCAAEWAVPSQDVAAASGRTYAACAEAAVVCGRSLACACVPVPEGEPRHGPPAKEHH